MTQTLGIFGAMAFLWVLLSGMFSPLLLGLGLLSVLLVTFVSVRMALIDRDNDPTRINLIRLGRYLCWLTGQIVLSNVDVARRILAGRRSISPTVLAIASTQRTELARVIFANSITLTPGTVSINVTENEIRVHALTREAAEALRQGEMDRRVTAVEGR